MNFYDVLNIKSNATKNEIRDAYKTLVMNYHPDKNNNDPYSIAYFSEIKEAYETLTNPVKKDRYLQELWYNRANGNKRTREVITPVTILKEVLEFEKYTSTMDVFRMDKERLFSYMNELLCEETISQLLHFNEPEINQQIVLTLLKPVRLLKSEKALLLKFFKEITVLMQNAEEVHVTGTGIAQEQFIHYLEDTPQFKNAVANETTTTKMADDKLIEYISQRFN